MKVKKRYIALGLFLALYGTCQLEICEFRSSESTQLEKLSKMGKSTPRFFSYEANGHQMHYTQVGSDTLAMVLFVHGAPGSSDNLLSYLGSERLTRVAQVAAVDRPGYGYSDFGVAERSLVKQAAAIKPIIDKPGPPKIVLVGHSFGGPVVARMAMDYPDLVSGLVLIAGSIDPKLEPHLWYQRPLDWWPIRWMLPPAVRVCNQEIITLREELEAMLPLWNKITCPVTIIQGTKDKLVPAGNAQFAESMLVNSERVTIDLLQNQNHFILWSHKEHVIDRILEVLEVERAYVRD